MASTLQPSDASMIILPSSGRHGQVGIGSAPRLPLQFQPISIVDQPVQDGIPKRRVGDASMPLSHGDLGGDQGGGSSVAIIHDFQEVLGLGAGQWVAQPVVQDQEVDASQGLQELGIGAIDVGQGELLQQAGSALVTHGQVGAAGGVGQDTSEKGLARAGGTENQGVEVLADPLALGQLQNQAAVQAARGGEVQVFQRGGQRELGRFEPPLQPFVIAVGTLLVDEQGQAILEGEFGILRMAELFLERGPQGR